MGGAAPGDLPDRDRQPEVCEQEPEPERFLPGEMSLLALLLCVRMGWRAPLQPGSPPSPGPGRCPPAGLASAWARLGAAGNMGLSPEMTVAAAYRAGPISWGPERERHSGKEEEEPVGGGTGWMSRNQGEGRPWAGRKAGAVNSHITVFSPHPNLPP